MTSYLQLTGVRSVDVKKRIDAPMFATLAQLVEQLTCNEQVVGSSPTSGSFFFIFRVLFGSHIVFIVKKRRYEF